MKWFLCTISAMLSLAGSLYAEQATEPTPHKQTQPTNIKGHPGHHLNANVSPEAYCPKKRPSNNGRFLLDASLYYFRPQIGGDEVVYTNSGASPYLPPLSGSIESANLGGGWGFDVGIGYETCPCLDHWKFRLGYTRLTTSNTNTTKLQGEQTQLIPLMGNHGITQNPDGIGLQYFRFCDRAKVYSSFNFNSFDVSLTRGCFVTKRLVLTPGTAVRGALITHNQDVWYTGGTPITGSGLISRLGLGEETVQITDKSDFWGIGPAVSIDANWYVSENFSLVSKLGSTFFYGRFGVTHKEHYTASEVNTINLRAGKFQYLPSAMLDLGLAYDVHFSKGCRFEASLVYGTEYFWNYNQALKVNNELGRYAPSSQDLAIQSGKLSLGLIF